MRTYHMPRYYHKTDNNKLNFSSTFFLFGIKTRHKSFVIKLWCNMYDFVVSHNENI